MEDYKPNSYRSKEEQKASSDERVKLDKIVQGAVKTKKKNEIRKFKEVFISEDVHNVKNYIFMDVLVPAIKDAIEDIITNGIRMILRGESGSRKTSSGASKVSYRSYYDDRRDDRRYSSSSTRAKTAYSYDDIILESRGEAEEVLERLGEIIDTYQMATVADLFDLVGISGSYTDQKYGWTNVRNAKVIRVREGYVLDLPKALPMN